MSEVSFQIRQLSDISEAQEDALVRLIMKAFGENPIMSATTGGEISNDKVYDTLIRCMVRAMETDGETWIAEKNGEIVGTALWFPPGKEFLSTERQREVVRWDDYLAMLRPEVADWLMNTLLGGTEELCAEVLGGPNVREEAQHLQMLAVDASQRKQGIGKALFEAGSKPALAKGKRVVWDTSRAHNVVLYKSWGAVEKGFREFDSPVEGPKVTIWVMELPQASETT